ncbi:hypothetical protein [Rhodococcus opacus]|uniref:hypothetical protein n=1 Tax=Rhodococcus opacus TaxID=37919 RepID=UPI001469F5B0|nr:hypothetical protein [Rhodococcus opacus]MDV7090754.1 hypothetical protein [Rhodococcus opacus]
MSFGLTVASSMMKETSEAATGEELGIVGGTSPVNALRPWQMRLCGRGAEDEPMTKPSTLKTAAVNRSIMSSL